MITNFYGGVKEEPNVTTAVTLGCGCTCNCPDTMDRVNGPQTCETNLVCQPAPKFVMPIPYPG